MGIFHKCKKSADKEKQNSPVQSTGVDRSEIRYDAQPEIKYKNKAEVFKQTDGKKENPDGKKQ